uniref:CEMIP beta-helix domain-containing protein n=1 Tax=Zooxanthella nutricula TaxID=1333877 RepID=A0A7S2JU28_9DINO
MLMGRYPLHFHLAGDASGSYVRRNSVRRSLNRCVTLHGTFGADVDGNVCLDTHGHSLYLEDGIEAGNRIVDNLVIRPLVSATVCSDFHDMDWAGNRPSVSGIWITNPNNTFEGNAVVGAAFGVWFTFPTNHEEHTPFSDHRGGFGGVFGASRAYFADPASGYGPSSWVNRQEQARTPTVFRNNTIKGSLRNGLFIDGLVTDSDDGKIPCLSGAGHQQPGECGTCPGTADTFSWNPTTFDINLEPSARSYTPTPNLFDDIVIAYGAKSVDDFSGVGSSYWASGGAVVFDRAIFAFNGNGASLDNRAVDWCAAHFTLGVGGYTAKWTNSLFIGQGDERAIKIYDGGFLIQDSRWAGLEYLAEMRSVSDGNTNGAQLTRSGPLGWFDADSSNDLFNWAMGGRVKLQPKSDTLPNLADWSSERIVGKWQSQKHLHLITTDGFGDHLKMSYTEFIYAGGRFSDEGWGPGVRKSSEAPACRMWLQCGWTVWCGTDVDCQRAFWCKDYLP